MTNETLRIPKHQPTDIHLRPGDTFYPLVTILVGFCIVVIDKLASLQVFHGPVHISRASTAGWGLRRRAEHAVGGHGTC